MAVACLFAVPVQAKATQATIQYDIAPERLAGNFTGLLVRLDLTVKSGSTLVLDVPGLLRSRLAPSGFTIDGGKWTAGTDGDTLSLKAAASHVRITYRLLSDGGKSLRAENQDMGIHANWFSLRGDEALLTPEGHEHAKATVHVATLDGWTVALSLTGPASLETVGDSMILGGANYRVMTRTVEGALFRLAYPEAMADRAETLLDDAATIITAERRFWGTPPKPVFIGLVELSDDSDFSGRGMQGGFSLYLGKSADQKALRRLIAHENMHNWISRAIGGFPATDSDLEAWLNEGFTEAFTARLLLSSGFWTAQDYIDDWNESLARYGTSPVKLAPNSRIQADRQRDFYVNRLPYDRGRILAVMWDRRFRARTQGRTGLADVLRAQMRQAVHNAKRGLVESADRLFPVVARRVTSVDLSQDLDRYVDKGEALVLDKDLFGPCLTVETVSQPVFDRGFDFQATLQAHNKVTGLEPGGPAEKAGLKAGDKVAIDEIPTNDSRVTLSYRVNDGNGHSHTVRYRPEGQTSITFQQLKARTSDFASCSIHWP